jgi:hypothetical protein
VDILFPCRLQLLSYLWQFAHSAQAAGADIDIASHTINFDTAALHIEDKTTTGSML